MTATATAPAPTESAPSARRIRVVFAALMLALALAALDQTIVGTALPTIVGDLGGLNHYSWVVTAYLLSSTISTPLHGKLGDLYGRKRVFQAAIVIFLVGSALCGLSQNMGQLIAFRGLQGLGGGGLIVGAQALVGDIVSPRERGRYQGLFGAVFGVSSVAGPLIGGFFVDNSSWRWVFYVNLPLGVVALATIAAVLHTNTERVQHTIDYLGAALMAGGVGCLILLTTWGGTQYDWGSPMIVGLGIGGLVLLGLFIRAEGGASEPVLPLRLFRNPVFSVACAIAFVAGIAMYGSITYLPQYQQIVRGVSATMSGLQLTPMMLGMLTTSIGSGFLISRTGRYKIFPIIGMSCMALGLLLLSRLTVDTSAWVLGGYMLVLGIGLGCVMQVTVLAVQNAVDTRDLGTATSSATFFRSIGGSFGVALFGAIFNASFARHFSGGGVDSLTGGPADLAKLPAGVRGPYIEAFANSLDDVFLVAVPVALVGLVIALFLREVPLRTTAGSLDGLSESFGMSRLGAADAIEEAEVRMRAARAALDRLDVLVADARVPAAELGTLRQVLTDRIAFLGHAVDRMEHPGEEVTPESWALLVTLLRIERDTLTGVSPPNGSEAGPAGLQYEADARLAAARTALGRLDALAATTTVAPERVSWLRELFEHRIAAITERVQHRMDVADDTPAAYWGLVVDVLETERRALSAIEAADEVSCATAARAHRNLAEEAELVRVGAS
ncbi:MAG TPA: MDR family MFS transporter [Acidimicrobiales bacterium]